MMIAMEIGFSNKNFLEFYSIPHTHTHAHTQESIADDHWTIKWCVSNFVKTKTKKIQFSKKNRQIEYFSFIQFELKMTKLKLKLDKQTNKFEFDPCFWLNFFSFWTFFLFQKQIWQKTKKQISLLLVDFVMNILGDPDVIFFLFPENSWLQNNHHHHHQVDHFQWYNFFSKKKFRF